MATITLTLQNVNGDPFLDGGNINITTGTTIGAVFNEPSGSVSLNTVLQNDSVTIILGVTDDPRFEGLTSKRAAIQVRA
jgi:hypothetical protein